MAELVSSPNRKNFVGDKRPCSSCGEALTVTEAMYKHRTYTCRPCHREQQRQYVERHRQRVRGARQKRRDVEKEWAQQALRSAVFHGIVVKPNKCERCFCPDNTGPHGQSLLQGHHEDYLKPLDVVWLCPACHTFTHREPPIYDALVDATKQAIREVCNPKPTPAEPSDTEGCALCHGTGVQFYGSRGEKADCPDCHGSGRVASTPAEPSAEETVCPLCGGMGRRIYGDGLPGYKCTHCSGTGKVRAAMAEVES